ncbi:YqgE/AlgH family protein [Luteolibacter algae]|uniref:YqgE/AlgH family protein n=1 Tax=Luteolibacter algae TaxID=454151 RepID=A0ABW5D7D3_9BACT
MDDSSASELPICLRRKLLLATPSLGQGIFERSVILLSEHDPDEGAVGIILNHPTDAKLGDLVSDPALSELQDLPVHRGGPLSTDQLGFTAFSWKKNKMDLKSGITAKTAVDLLKRGDCVVRATVGYSAWSPGQLESEILAKAWFTSKPTADLISLPHDLSLWKNLLRQISPYHHLLSYSPRNPLLN